MNRWPLNQTYPLLFVFCAACGPAHFSSSNAPALTFGVTTPIIASPSTANLQSYQTLQLSVSGGISPYSYQLLSGNGQVGFSSGMFSAGGSASTNVILVSDASGATTTVTILVNGGSTQSSGSSATATDCSAMLSAPNAALMDNSSTGLAYATAVNYNDATSCSNWCSSAGAGYCMWSPGSGTTAPVCVGWPKGTTMKSYMSSWTTYAATCK